MGAPAWPARGASTTGSRRSCSCRPGRPAAHRPDGARAARSTQRPAPRTTSEPPDGSRPAAPQRRRRETVLLSWPDDQLAAHLAAAVLDLEVAVVREGAGAVGAELEGDRLARAGALGDTVGLERQAVRDVISAQFDLD